MDFEKKTVWPLSLQNLRINCSVHCSWLFIAYIFWIFCEYLLMIIVDIIICFFVIFYLAATWPMSNAEGQLLWKWLIIKVWEIFQGWVPKPGQAPSGVWTSKFYILLKGTIDIPRDMIFQSQIFRLSKADTTWLETIIIGILWNK